MNTPDDVEATRQPPLEEPGDPQAGRNATRLWFAVVLIAAIIIAGTGILVYRIFDQSHEDPSAQQNAPAGTNAPGPAAADLPTCLDHRDSFNGQFLDSLGLVAFVPRNSQGQLLAPQSPSTAAEPAVGPALPPECVMWQQVNDIAIVPFTREAGPTRLIDGRAEGFAHTPSGAATAALQIYYRLNALTKNGYQQQLTDLVRHQIVGTDSQVVVQQATEASQGNPEALLAATHVRMSFYQPTIARVSLAVGPFDGGLYSLTDIDVVWSDGDWRLSMQNGWPVWSDGQTITSADYGDWA